MNGLDYKRLLCGRIKMQLVHVWLGPYPTILISLKRGTPLSEGYPKKRQAVFSTPDTSLAEHKDTL